ncbi:MAG TPA: T9SS type A sorting domain-containing protein [Saprospiraceae bacterium]
MPVDTIIDFDTNPELKDLHLRKQLYQTLKDGLIDSMENITLYQFYSVSDTISYGRLVDVRQLFEVASISSPGKKASTIAAALAKNNEITNTEDYYVYETETNELLAEYLQDGDLEVLLEAEGDIRDVATLCPYEFGDGVYMNRSWIRAIDLGSGFDEIDACGAIEPRSSQKGDDAKSTDVLSQCHLWPNPAHVGELINLLSNQSISKIIVTDILGRKIIDYIPSAKAEGDFQFDISQNGSYIVNVWNEIGQRMAFHQIIVD